MYLYTLNSCQMKKALVYESHFPIGGAENEQKIRFSNSVDRRGDF